MILLRLMGTPLRSVGELIGPLGLLMKGARPEEVRGPLGELTKWRLLTEEMIGPLGLLTKELRGLLMEGRRLT